MLSIDWFEPLHWHSGVMETVAARMPRAVVVRKALLVLASGFVVGGLVWLEMWFFDVAGAVPWGLGAGVATSVALAVLGLLTTVTGLEIDERRLQVTRSLGRRREYLLAEHGLRIFGVAEGALFCTVLFVQDADGREFRVPLAFGDDKNSQVVSFLTRRGLLE